MGLMHLVQAPRAMQAHITTWGGLIVWNSATRPTQETSNVQLASNCGLEARGWCPLAMKGSTLQGSAHHRVQENREPLYST